MKLFFSPNTCSLAPHIALRFVGAHFELERIDFDRNEQRSESFLKVSPTGRVPALEIQEGILTETPAILAYIASQFPEAQLAPQPGTYQYAKMLEFNNYISSTLHVAHAHSRRGERWSDDPKAVASMKDKAPENVQACYRLIETHYAQGPWILGEDLSMCDLYLFAVVQWTQQHIDSQREFPKIFGIHKALSSKEPIVVALSVEEAKHGYRFS